MSQQPCLPVSRRRKHPSDIDTPSDEHHHGILLPKEEEIRISDVAQNMDALEYLAMVREQAEKFPDTFVSQAPRIHHQGKNAKLDETFIPIDGSAASMEYLLSHRMELIRPPSRAHLPCYYYYDNKSSPIDTNNPSTAFTLVVANEQEQKNDVKQWIQITMADFSTLRQYLSQCRDAGLGTTHWNTITMNDGAETTVLQERIPVPASKDRSGWHVFCLGRNEAMGNVGGYFDDPDNEDDEDESDNISHESGDNDMFPASSNDKEEPNPQQTVWDVKTVPPKGHSPTTRLVCQFDQVLTRRVLSHHVHYLCEGWIMTRSRGLWIYACLSRLEKPLHRDDASLLRKLLRELCRLRAQIVLPDGPPIHTKGPDSSSLRPEETLLSTLNVLITIVGFYFEQSGEADGIMQASSNTLKH